MRRLCSLCRNGRPRNGVSACSPRCPNGVCPRSWPSAIASVRSSFSAERPSRGPGDLAHLERVGEPDAVVVALGREEHLRLVLQAAERLGVDDAVPVALEARPEVVLRLVVLAALARRRERRRGRKGLAFDLLGAFSRDGHAPILPSRSDAPYPRTAVPSVPSMCGPTATASRLEEARMRGVQMRVLVASRGARGARGGVRWRLERRRWRRGATATGGRRPRGRRTPARATTRRPGASTVARTG